MMKLSRRHVRGCTYYWAGWMVATSVHTYVAGSSPFVGYSLFAITYVVRTTTTVATRRAGGASRVGAAEQYRTTHQHAALPMCRQIVCAGIGGGRSGGQLIHNARIRRTYSTYVADIHNFTIN
eukprot:101892-Prorocentrum_minimum.AAC.12